MKLQFEVNGEERAAEVMPLKRLLDVLREDLRLTGAKEGCGEGECGACSVIIDGQLVNSCLVAASQVQGARITTVEGLAAGKELLPVQQCFIERGGAQCGICTPGMIVAAHCFLQSGKEATDANVREAIAGNLCRCTGYQKIVEAIQQAAGVTPPEVRRVPVHEEGVAEQAAAERLAAEALAKATGADQRDSGPSRGGH